MLVNLHINTVNCFSVIVPKIRDSVSPSESFEPFSFNTKKTTFRYLNRKEFEPVVEFHARCSTKCVKEQKEKNHFGAKKVHAKCSTKWDYYYGGYIPEILEALEDETIDIEEALNPWEARLNNKERTIILKEQTNWKRCLEIFEYFMNKGGHELNVIHYNIVLCKLGEASQWSHVACLWDDMCQRRIAPKNSTYGTLIGAYSRAGFGKEALCWLTKMFKQGLKPDEVTMLVVFQLFKRSGEYLKAAKIFEKWSKIEGGFLSLNVYNTIIDSYGKAGRIEKAGEVFSLMLGKGISPNTVTFNTMINIAGKNGSFEEVESLLKKMEELHCFPNTWTYSILISLYAKSDDIASATKYFRVMKEARLEPNLVTYRTLLMAYSIRQMVGQAEEIVSEIDSCGLKIDEFSQSALTRMYVDANEIEKSMAWFRRFHLEGDMSSECYAANIEAYGERGFVSEAEDVFFCCRDSKRLSIVVFNVMIKAYGIAKRYSEACDLFDSMQCRYNVKLDKFSYNSLIQILARADLANEAIPYLRKMQNPDCITYCAVISSFAKLGELEKAESLYDEMIGRDIEIDVVVFGILINAFAEVGCVEKAAFYYGEMKRLGFSGNMVIYNSLVKLYNNAISLHASSGRYNDVIATFDDMLRKMTLEPDDCTFKSLASVLEKSGLSKLAVEELDEFRKRDPKNGIPKWAKVLRLVV